jgi:hypothetical protein
VNPLSLLFICLLLGSLNLRMQSSDAQDIKASVETRRLQFVSQFNELIKANWLQQTENALAKTEDNPIEIKYTIDSLCVAYNLKLLKSSNFPALDCEALRAVSNIPPLKICPFQPNRGLTLISTFSGKTVTTEFVGVSFVYDSLPPGDWELPGMMRKNFPQKVRQQFVSPDDYNAF